jgi:4-hydroxy-tetrahydrodipicolinate synthase
MTQFKGSITALVTPFKDGAVDEAAFRSFINWQIQEGTSGLVPVGTTGESPTLSHKEHERVVEICVEEAKGRASVIAGAGSNSTAEAVAFSKHAEKVGADAVLIVTPYYNKPTQEGLYQHFKAINDAIGIPIFIYNIPGRSVIDMSVETMARLYELKNIAGVKDATGFHPALRRGCDRTRLHGPWRPRLHLGDLERRAPALRRDAERLPER